MSSMNLLATLRRYQKRIGSYDKQQWERNVEQHVCRGLAYVPKKTGKLKPQLIDVDLVRGSMFPKAKPAHGFFYLSQQGIKRGIFLPVFFKWWISQTSLGVFAILLCLWLLQVASLTLYIIALQEGWIQNVSTEEVVIPFFVMLVLSVTYSQIVSTHTSMKPFRASRPSLLTKRVKRTKRRSTGFRRSPIKTVSPESNDARPTILRQSFNRSSSEEPKKSIIENGSLRNNKRALSIPITDRPSVVTFAGSASDTQLQNKDLAASVLQKTDSRRAFDSEDEQGIVFTAGSSDTRNKLIQVNGLDCNTPLRIDPVKIYGRRSMDVGDARFSGRTTEAESGWDVSGLDISSGDMETDMMSDNEIVDTDRHPRRRHITPSQLGSSSSNGMRRVDLSRSSQCNSSAESDAPSQPHSPGPYTKAGLSGTIGSGTTCPSSTKVSCTMWEGGDVKKAELTVLDISAAIIRKVEALPECNDYFYIGIFFSISIALLPLMWRMQNVDWLWLRELAADSMVNYNSTQLLGHLKSSFELGQLETFIISVGFVERFSLAFFLFFLLSIAERTFKQRFLLAKHFCHLTSARRARRSELPHFRLNKVRNIKIWLSVRSYLRKHGPQRSVDMIVSSAYLITLFIISFLCFELLKESDVGFYRQLLHVELTAWSFSTAVFLLRFMTLGAKINKKYRNISVLITEQINLYLQMEQKPQKKEELILAHNVLKLATDLLKELESPFKISGFSANPILYNITKLAFLSAASGALSELLGFKLKLYKIKFRG